MNPSSLLETPRGPAGDSLPGYDAVRRAGGAGLIDRSGRAALRLTGPDRQSFLQGMVSNDVAALASGQGCRAALLDSTGHLLAELTVLALPDALLLETDPRCARRVAETLDKYLIMEEVEIADVSADWAILSVIGDGARAVFTDALALSVPGDLPPLAHIPFSASGADGFAVNTPEAAPGYDLWLPISIAAAVRSRLIRAGAVPVGEEAAEILRIEAGIPAWGSELSESVLLPEAEMADAASYTKGCYVGQEIVARLHARGHTNRALRGLLLPSAAPVPASGAIIHAAPDSAEPGREIGRITSAVRSPRFDNRPLALGYVRREYLEDGTRVLVSGAPAIVLTRPFDVH